MATDAGDARSDRGIGLAGALAIGIGGMVGGGIFAVLGEAVALAHGATPLAFLAGGVIALLTAHSYSRLTVSFPSQGGTVVFIDQAFGIDLATGTVNLMLWLSYLVTLSLYAVAFGAYALTFFPAHQEPWLRHVLITLGIAVPLAINLLNAEIVSQSETLIVVLKLVLLGVVVAAGAGHIDAARLNPAAWSPPLATLSAGMVIFVAYEGFELIANAAQDMRTPRRTVPKAFYGSVLLVVVLYVLVSAVTVGSVPADRIAVVKDYALAEAARPALGVFGFRLVACSALLATLSAINATLYGNARLGYILARDGELPEALEHRAWQRPVEGVLIVGGLSMLMANLIDLTAIAIIASAGFLLVFAAVNAAAVRLARQTGGSRGISLAGCGACLAALVMLLTQTYATSPHAVWVFGLFMACALAFELTYPRLRHRPLHILPH